MLIGTRKFNRLVLICLPVLLLCFSGCATSGGRRFYSDTPRQIKDVAIVYCHPACSVNSITESGKPAKNLYGGGRFLAELLPGDYSFIMRYVKDTTYESSYGKPATLELHVEPGHVYYVSGKAEGNTWHPEVINITKDEDYNKLNNEFF